MKQTAAALALATAAVLGVAPTAAADGGPRPFSLVTTDLPRVSHHPVMGTFTASGLPDCSAGTFADSLVFFTASGTPLVITETYSCTSGLTFTARLLLHLTAVAPDGTQGVQGTWRILGSDVGFEGSGTTSGTLTDCTPTGIVFAECSGGTGVIVGQIR